ncbi:MAG: HAD-IA family hydrolase [Acidobacteria bacterium]|nr:HAD-IA family hydrolase [Acidobacteriota bacterium]
MKNGFSVYLFDVDGTLTDSATDITSSVAEVIRRHGLPAQTQENLRTYIGKHLRELFFDITPGMTEERSDALIQEYRSIYLAREHNHTSVYPGIRESLAALGGRKSTATTKGTPTTMSVLEKFDLLRFFDHVQGTDGFPAKPAPDVIHRSLQALGAQPEDVLFVGDSAADMAAGRAAGVTTCAVRWGYGNFEEMARHSPDYWIDHPSELAALRP